MDGISINVEVFEFTNHPDMGDFEEITYGGADLVIGSVDMDRNKSPLEILE